MGIVNVTPDSFSDGGAYLAPADALAHGRRLLDEGADWLDVGGESTRPGADAVTVDEELSRVIPVVEALAADAPVSIDTTTSTSLSSTSSTPNPGALNQTTAALPSPTGASLELGPSDSHEIHRGPHPHSRMLIPASTRRAGYRVRARSRPISSTCSLRPDSGGAIPPLR